MVQKSNPPFLQSMPSWSDGDGVEQRPTFSFDQCWVSQICDGAEARPAFNFDQCLVDQMVDGAEKQPTFTSIDVE